MTTETTPLTPEEIASRAITEQDGLDFVRQQNSKTIPILCHCGALAEVRWKQPSTANAPHNEHELCSNCMSGIWSEIQLRYQTSESHEASTFEEIRQ